MTSIATHNATAATRTLRKAPVSIIGMRTGHTTGCAPAESQPYPIFAHNAACVRSAALGNAGHDWAYIAV